VLFFLVKRIGNGAVIIGLSLHPDETLDNGIRQDDNDTYGRHGKVGKFTIGQSTMEKMHFLRHGQRRRDYIDAIFGRRIVSQNKKRLPYDN
jgi:hypothetical protein